jgi:hypothetical protein
MYFYKWLIRTSDNLLMPDGTLKPTTASAQSVWRLILPRSTLSRQVIRAMSNVVGYLPADFNLQRRSTNMIQSNGSVSTKTTFSNAKLLTDPNRVSYVATTVIDYPYQVSQPYFVLSSDEVLTPNITTAGSKQGCGSDQSSCTQTWSVDITLEDNQCDFLLIGYFISELECAVQNDQLCPEAGSKVLTVVSLGVQDSNALCPQSINGKSKNDTFTFETCLILCGRLPRDNEHGTPFVERR